VCNVIPSYVLKVVEVKQELEEVELTLEVQTDEEEIVN